MSQARLILPNDPLYVGAAASFAARLAERAGFGQDAMEAIRIAVDEACAYVLDRCAPEHSQDFSVTLELTGNGLTVSVRDRGLPVDADALERQLQEVHEDQESELGLKLMRALMDEVTFLNRGRAGNEVRLHKRYKADLRRLFSHHFESVDTGAAGSVHDPPPGLPEAGSTRGEAGQETGAARTAPPETGQSRAHVRLVRPQEAVEVSRCLYRSYGYNYTGSENVYRPDWIAGQTRSGGLISAVSVLDSGEVVGHTALVRTHRQSAYEMGLGAVLPGYRGLGLLRRMIALLLDTARTRGIGLVQAEPVTSHPHSQTACLAFDFVECGLLLGTIPAEEAGTPGRVSLLPMLLRLGPSPARPIFPPRAMAPVVEVLTERLSLEREIVVEAARQPGVAPGAGRLHWTVHPPMLQGRVVVEKVGRRSREQVLNAMRRLLAGGMVELLVDLPLDDPGAPGLAELLMERGFFFAAYYPGMEDDPDLLRLQYLSPAATPPAEIVAVSELAGHLREFVLSDRERRTRTLL